jgi:hypothetical protein
MISKSPIIAIKSEEDIQINALLRADAFAP